MLLEPEPVARLVADPAEDPRGVVDERQVVEDAEQARLEVGPPAEGVDQPPEVGGLQRRRHRIDREVAAEEVLAQAGALDRRQRRGRVVELGARRHDVDARIVPVRHDCGAEPLVRRGAAVERVGERPRELDRVALDRDVDVEALLAEQDVPHRAADEVDALRAVAERRDGLEQRAEALEAGELVREALGRLVACRLDPFERAQQVGASHDADERAVAEHRDAPVLQRS